MSYDTVRSWKNKFESGVESIKNAPKSGRPKFASRKESVSKVKEIIEGDARFKVRDIARKVGISLSTVHLILKKHLKVRKIFARWVPHLLTDDQTDNGLKWPKRCFKCFKLVTKSSLPMSSQVMKIGSIILSPSESLASKRSIIAKRSLSARKVWYAIFFSGEGVAIKVPMENGKKTSP